MPVTNKRRFRFIFTGANDGATNMAMDEAVMLGLKDCLSTPVLRIYKWTPPTITLGYFQSSSDINFNECRKDGIGVVRRLTGGRAVLHFEELTYSILFTEEDFTPFRKKDLFVFIAGCLIESLGSIGIMSKVASKTRGNLKSPNCFASPAQFEIESHEQGKLIGSAQVIRDGVILQHGAIPLTESYTKISKYLKKDETSFQSASSLRQVSGLRVGEEQLFEALKMGFGKYLWLENGNLNDFETEKSLELYRDKYSKKEWIFRK